MNEDGLLDPLDLADDQWLWNMNQLDPDDPMRNAVRTVGDIFSSRDLVWPAVVTAGWSYRLMLSSTTWFGWRWKST